MAPILIASAAQDVAEILRNALRAVGHETLAVASVAGAVDALRKRRVTLAILDLELPSPGGVDLCRNIRAEPGTVELPNVASASERREADRVAVLELGVDDAVTRRSLVAPALRARGPAIRRR
jgi:DNA-binding response OmpR family regulator